VFYRVICTEILVAERIEIILNINVSVFVAVAILLLLCCYV